MRTPLLAAALGLSLIGCVIGDGSDGPGADDQGPGTDPGSSPGSTEKRVDVTVDKTTMATELKTANPIMVTVTGSGGFSGPVTLAGTVVDANNAALTGWTVDFSDSTVTLAANGTATSVATVKVPALSAGLAGTVQVTATSAATVGTHAATTTVTALNQVTFAVKVDAGTGKCVYTAESGTVAAPVTIALGTKLRFFNTGTANLEIHSTNSAVFSHQGQAPNGMADPVTEANTAYEQTPTAKGASTWYCHAPATDLGANDPRVVVQ